MKSEKVGIIGESTFFSEIDFDKAFGVGSDAYLQHYENVKHLEKIRYSHLTKKEREAIIVDIRREPKINRNSICICGSGKKYKKCCIKNTCRLNNN